MSPEQTHKQIAPGRRPALRKGIAVMLVVLLAGVVVWVVKNRQRGPVEVSFEGLKTRVSAPGWNVQVAVFRVKNGSSVPISYHGRVKQEPCLVVSQLGLRGRQMDILDDVVLPAGGVEWQMLNPGEEVEVERSVWSRNRFWDVELKYIEGEQKGTAVQIADFGDTRGEDVTTWKTARSGSLWPVNWRP